MKILVIGATGLTGKFAVKKLLARGHDVTAFARKPADITDRPERLKVVEGEVRNQESLDRAALGQDAVLVTFGPRSLQKDDLQEVFARNLIVAMKKANVKRLVELSAWGAGSSNSQMKFVFKIIRNTFLKNMFDDKERGEELLTKSDLEWTLARPGRLKDDAARGGIKASLDGSGITAWMNREDVADFMCDEIEKNAWIRKAPLIGYAD
jgi:putative NADH-flavin reductase